MKLLKELEQIFVKKGVEVCYLEVRVDNVGAREMYRKQGYEVTRRLEDYYAKRTHGIQLAKKLGT